MAMAGMSAATRGADNPALSWPSIGSGIWLILPAVLLAYSTLVPQEVRIAVAGQNIYPPRMVLFLLLPWMLARIVRGHYPFRPADALMFFASGWMLTSFIVFYGPAEGIVRGAAIVLDMLGPYVVARLCIRSLTDLRRLLVLFAPGVLLAGLSMMVESVTHTLIVSPLAASIFGPLPRYESGIELIKERSFYDYRMGLLRAAGPFSHPIMGGLMLASLLPLYFTSGLRHWPRVAGVAAGAMAFFSVSSAAFLSMLIFAVLIGYDRLQRVVTFINWRLFLGLGFVIVLVLELASQNGLVNVIGRYTLNPQTAAYRLLIWEYGVQSVYQNPVWGIAYTNYERPLWMSSSIDNNWLLLGIRHGVVVPIALLLVPALAIAGLSAASVRRTEMDRRLFVGMAVALFSLTLAGFTVAFFGGLLTWFYLLLGIAFSMLGANDRPAGWVAAGSVDADQPRGAGLSA